MTIFGLSITKKSKLATVDELLDLVNSHNDLILQIGELQELVDGLKAEIEPLKAFVAEHGKNILEAEEAFVKEQTLRTEGIEHVLGYTYETAMKKGDK
jgi:peptidoglycan hydrolase CwlO-like protein